VYLFEGLHISGWVHQGLDNLLINLLCLHGGFIFFLLLCVQGECADVLTQFSGGLFFVSQYILYIIPLTPTKLSAGRKNRTGAKGASAWPDDQKRHRGRRPSRRRDLSFFFFCKSCFWSPIPHTDITTVEHKMWPIFPFLVDVSFPCLSRASARTC